MKGYAKVKKSRVSWKKKAVKRGKELGYKKKEYFRLKRDRNRYKRKYKEAMDLLEYERKKQLLFTQNKIDLVYIVFQIFIISCIGFRAVSRVLGVIGPYLGIQKVPCTQTIINWVTRLSIVKMQEVIEFNLGPICIRKDEKSNRLIFMLDISIGLGAGKILTLLGLDYQHHKSNPKAPTLKDLRCLAVSVSETWTGELIAEFLSKVIAVLGRPAAFLKDGGTDLGKAVRILGEQSLPYLCIDDISHKIANFLKEEYGKDPLFEIFLSTCGKVSKKLKQTILACLAPPKVSVKARFMNLHRLVAWSDKLLSHSPPGGAKKGSLLERLRKSMGDLPKCKSFICRFLRDAKPLLACQKILKTQGLNRLTYEKSEKLIEGIPSGSAIRVNFMRWLKDQLHIAEKLGVEKIGLPISTDQIESLFAIGKGHGTGQIKDANRIAMRLPIFCGPITKEDARKVLEVSVRQQNDIFGSMISLTKQRREVLPNPGKLESLADSSQEKNIELILDPKTG